MKTTELRSKTLAELMKDLRAKRQELSGLKIKQNLGQFNSVNILKGLKRDIAQICTIITEIKHKQAKEV